jgi:hypothetical protein
MFTTTTTRPVKFHGWTLPKGAKVYVTRVVVEKFSSVEQYTTASVTYTPKHKPVTQIAVPTDALAATYTDLQTVPWHTEYLY